MQRIDIIDRKLNSARELHSLVKTMKGLAAVSINQYEYAVDSINQYFSTIEMGLQIILKSQPQLVGLMQPEPSREETKRLAIVFGAGQPMCGSFNEVLATYFNQQWNQKGVGDTKITVTGQRIRTNLSRLGWEIDHQIEMPTTIERINDTVQQLVLSIQEWHSINFREVYLFYNHPVANSYYAPMVQQLLPIQADWLQRLANKPWEGRSIPTYSMDVENLVSALLKHLLFVSIYRAFSASLSAENNSRLAAMQVAEKKIEEMIQELTQAYRSCRQINITEEILDIMASFEVQRDDLT